MNKIQYPQLKNYDSIQFELVNCVLLLEFQNKPTY